ncbi:putative histone-lysine N-methyltransferase PRDM6 [Platysternon megacephalum]|uniref:Putative histone-lysine N-methyltransferase PRDM6 n=1 Tax=Platysternon megacephalum TaxID=55544 RepID=A0A4D9ERD7_9SAUR|nr:putative histone-lysine N-methyltransferase PRDM6 [Platysternon megacephalum]
MVRTHWHIDILYIYIYVCVYVSTGIYLQSVQTSWVSLASAQGYLMTFREHVDIKYLSLNAQSVSLLALMPFPSTLYVTCFISERYQTLGSSNSVKKIQSKVTPNGFLWGRGIKI